MITDPEVHCTRSVISPSFKYLNYDFDDYKIDYDRFSKTIAGHICHGLKSVSLKFKPYEAGSVHLNLLDTYGKIH